jgi:hypothetical protein
MLAELRGQAEKQRKHARSLLRAALGTPELRRQLHVGDVPLYSPCMQESGSHDLKLPVTSAMKEAELRMSFIP